MKRQWTRDELTDHWVLAPNELALLANKIGATRLGFAVLLKGFMLEARFPRQKHDVPGVVVVHLADQVRVSADLYPSYEWSGRTIEYHRAQIREFLGFREPTVQDGHQLADCLAEHVLPNEHREDQSARRCSNVAAVCTSSHPQHVASIGLCARHFMLSKSAGGAAVLERLDAATQRALDDLLVTGSTDDDIDAEATETRRSGLNELKADAGAISLESVLAEIDKLKRLRSLGLPTDLSGDVSLKVVERFRQRAAAEAPSELRAHAPALRATLVAALCWLRQREVTDSLVDLLIQVIHKINVRAEKRVEKQLLDDFKRITGKLSGLFDRGLGDDEYVWEPGPGCWSIRWRGERSAPIAAGSGAFTIDFAFPEPQPAPLTTIAWRLGHIIVGVLGVRVAAHFGGPPADYQTFAYAGTAADALQQLDQAYTARAVGVRSLGAAGLARACGPGEGPFAEYPMATLVLHINREVVHHGAEIALLRDLY